MSASLPCVHVDLDVLRASVEPYEHRDDGFSLKANRRLCDRHDGAQRECASNDRPA